MVAATGVQPLRSLVPQTTLDCCENEGHDHEEGAIDDDRETTIDAASCASQPPQSNFALQSVWVLMIDVNKPIDCEPIALRFVSLLLSNTTAEVQEAQRDSYFSSAGGGDGVS